MRVLTPSKPEVEQMSFDQLAAADDAIHHKLQLLQRQRERVRYELRLRLGAVPTFNPTTGEMGWDFTNAQQSLVSDRWSVHLVSYLQTNLDRPTLKEALGSYLEKFQYYTAVDRLDVRRVGP